MNSEGAATYKVTEESQTTTVNIGIGSVSETASIEVSTTTTTYDLTENKAVEGGIELTNERSNMESTMTTVNFDQVDTQLKDVSQESAKQNYAGLARQSLDQAGDGVKKMEEKSSKHFEKIITNEEQN